MNITPPKVKKNFLSRVEEIVGPKSVSIKNVDRINYCRDSTFKYAIQYRYNALTLFPDVIAWPQTVEQVKELVKACIRFRVPIIPYGAGSGVSGGTLPLKGGLIIDLKKMRRFIRLDPVNLLAEVQTGMMGMHLEDELQRKGFTLGHFPSSIICASLGGYLAARSAGQLSSRYGKIEDMVLNMEVVTGKGDIIETRDVCNKTGLDLNQVFLGSEGTLGLITKTLLRVYPLPEARTFRGIRFKNMRQAMEAIRRVMQSGLKPSVVRLYDELDTMMLLSNKTGRIKLPNFFKSIKENLKMKTLKAALMMPQVFAAMVDKIPGGCLLVLMHEGCEKIVQEEENIVLAIAKSLDGEDLGEEPGRYWHEHRYSVSYNASKIFYEGAFTDTIEVASTWDKIYPLYRAVVKAISPYAVVMAHMSHVYQDGGSLYFTFVAPLKGPHKSEALYDLIWEKALKATQEVGGAISHHHGVGRIKAKFMSEEWGQGVQYFREFKNLYDPHRIMNPGKLILLDKDSKGKEAA